MHFVDRDRRIAAPAARPRCCIQSSSCQRCGSGCGDDRGGVPAAASVCACQRVGLQRQPTAVRADDVVFVARARRDPRHEQLPNAGADGAAASDGGDGPRY